MTTLLIPQRAQRVVDHVAAGVLRGAPGSFLARYIRTGLAGSGVLMLGYVIVHMVGNVLAFGGPAIFNGYARGLRELGTPLIPEGGLLLLVRVVLAATLAPHLYVMLHPDIPSALALPDVAPPWYASLPLVVLPVSGALIALLVGDHLAQLAFGAVHPSFVPGYAYQNTVVALRFWPVTVLNGMLR